MTIHSWLRNTIFRRMALWIFLCAAAGGWLAFRSSGSVISVLPVTLASFTENGVEVNIQLQLDAKGQYILSGTFTPTEAGFHVYSKDIPRDGIEGLGRPTLLELPPNSKLKPVGLLQESLVPLSEPIQKDLPQLRVYPEGPVKLSLSVVLPQVEGETTDSVAVTYMACSQKGCKRPVEAKIILVHYERK
jgi:hypothetical protein